MTKAITVLGEGANKAKLCQFWGSSAGTIIRECTLGIE